MSDQNDPVHGESQVQKEAVDPVVEESTVAETAEKPPFDQVVDEILAGRWGRGTNLVTRLTAEGYTAEEIRAFYKAAQERSHT